MRPGSIKDAQSFFTYFRREQAAIAEAIAGVDSVVATEQLDSVEHSGANIALLEEEVEAAAGFLTLHDRHVYSDAIRQLQQALQQARSKMQTGGEQRRRFIFHTQKNESALSVNDCIDPHPLPEQPAESDLRDHLDAKLSLPTTALTSQAMRVAQMHSCVVDLRSKAASGRFASVTLTDIHDSLVVLGDVDGPVQMTGMHNSTIVLAGCRQCRIHESSGTHIYLSCRSRPITEECTNMVFSPVPSALQTGEQCVWDQVDDFNNVHGGPANFTLAAKSSSIDWPALLEGTDARDILACVQR